MLFLGDNAQFGENPVELSAERLVEPIVHDGERFPFGVDGLLPVVTERRKKGGSKTVYAFPFAEGEPPADNPAAQELCDATDFVNRLLQEASELSGHEFGSIGALWLGIPKRGYSFTRVEAVCAGETRSAPFNLRLETSDLPKEPDTLSAVLEYDPHGYVRNVLMVEYAENGISCRATAAVDFSCDDVCIRRVVQSDAQGNETELYWGF